MQILQLNSSFYSQAVALIRSTDSKLNWSDKQIFESFNENHLVFGFIDNDKLIAIAIFSYILDTSELLYICIAKTSQAKGVASKLLAKTITKLKKLKIKEIFLEVDIKNNIAISLYEKLEFKQIAMRKKYYKYKSGHISDALVYKFTI